jgi:hypothetical protein
MYNIEIIGKVMIDDFVNIINCNVYDSKKNLIKSDVCGTHYLHDNDVKLIDFDVVNKTNIESISDLCNNSVVFHFLNLRDLTYENR